MPFAVYEPLYRSSPPNTERPSVGNWIIRHVSRAGNLKSGPARQFTAEHTRCAFPSNIAKFALTYQASDVIGAVSALLGCLCVGQGLIASIRKGFEIGNKFVYQLRAVDVSVQTSPLVKPGLPTLAKLGRAHTALLPGTLTPSVF